MTLTPAEKYVNLPTQKEVTITLPAQAGTRIVVTGTWISTPVSEVLSAYVVAVASGSPFHVQSMSFSTNGSYSIVYDGEKTTSYDVIIKVMYRK